MNTQTPNQSPYAILDIDPWLKSFQGDIELRMDHYYGIRKQLLGEKNSFREFASGHDFYGFHRSETGWVYREWAPAAEALFLLGDFNGWNRYSHPLERRDTYWQIDLPGRDALSHLSRVKVMVRSFGIERDRIPLYIHKIVQDPNTNDFSGQIWAPDVPFTWTDSTYQVPADQQPLIYETHVGMAQEKYNYGTYVEFADNILPRIKDLGYNTVQIMAIMEHPYYGSFGYHVSNYFAASSWFGTPDDLKYLINQAHSLGIAVLMDIVQSHAVKNLAEGLNEFDGTDYQFFHSGARGNHSAWDSKCFDYSRHEVIHFLLSSIRYWLEEFHFDGFRFDGVTSMLYQDHGLGTAFDNYGKYFSHNTDIDAVTYLQFANDLIHEIRPDAISVAEDMSGMPGMCLPVKAGGLGFDYRLAMGMPDYWVKTLKLNDHNWSMNAMWHELSTTRPQEKRIGYVESHDQALVGDKTAIFRMADQDMYWFMDKGSQSLVIDRAIALHKMIRWVTIALGSEGYLTFMGNEFGHPEWIDFPRAGNGWSFHHCRRQWSLVDNPELRYKDLNDFDRAMIHFMADNKLLGKGGTPTPLWIDQDRKIIAFKNEGYVFVFNFHPTESYPFLELPVHEDGRYQVVMDTDEWRFGGQGRIFHDSIYQTESLPMNRDYQGLILYAPCRTAMVLKKV
ncbi:MAG: alpha-amylase family glycosyl hydrolase [Eubacteriales bacterium]|nr:alpha-amylase family glycosyl hydrolase [Eubacteriales bacterium]